MKKREISNVTPALSFNNRAKLFIREGELARRCHYAEHYGVQLNSMRTVTFLVLFRNSIFFQSTIDSISWIFLVIFKIAYAFMLF